MILCSLLSVVISCLLLVVRRFCLVATLGDRTLSWDCLDWFFLITGIIHTIFVVPHKLWSSFVPPCCCSFFLFQLMSLTCVSTLFVNLVVLSCSIRENYCFGCLLDIQLETLCNCHDTFLLCWWACELLCLNQLPVLFASSLFGHWLQHQGLTSPIKQCFFLSNAG